MKISIIVPSYNESHIIEKTLINIVEYFNKQSFDYQVIVVDDGSTDKTRECVRKFCSSHKNIEVLENNSNRGKGYAVRKGILHGEGDYLLFMDADLATPLSEFEKFRPKIFLKKPIIVGSRKMNGANIIQHQPFLREAMGKVFTFLTNFILGCRLTDYTCGFKIFSKIAAKDLFSKQITERWAYDAEIMFLANKYGYPIEEIPVTWSNKPNTKVKLLKDAINSLFELILIRYNYLKGRYNHDV